MIAVAPTSYVYAIAFTTMHTLERKEWRVIAEWLRTRLSTTTKTELAPEDYTVVDANLDRHAVSDHGPKVPEFALYVSSVEGRLVTRYGTARPGAPGYIGARRAQKDPTEIVWRPTSSSALTAARSAGTRVKYERALAAKSLRRRTREEYLAQLEPVAPSPPATPAPPQAPAPTPAPVAPAVTPPAVAPTAPSKPPAA